jgi:tetratricopeptide (TPR) repeat protein
MERTILIIFLFFPFVFLRGEENLTSLSLQAEALWEARDYTAASKIYEKLLSQSFPDWQKARVLYNLGTLRLAQKQPIEALELFQKIKPVDLSLPTFGRDLFLNQGIAYLYYAHTLPTFDQQLLFIGQALKAFEQAQLLDCQVQKEEQKESSSSCHAYFPLDQWVQFAQQQIQAISQQKQQLKNEKVTPSSTILQQALDQANHTLKLFLTSQATTNDSAKKEQSDPDLKKQQEAVLTQAAAFIPAVLKEQERRFQQATDSTSSCQQSPWDQVIPLFDHGYRSAQNADEQLGKTPWNGQVIIAYQEQTIQDWQQALKLLLNPPSQNMSAPPQQLMDHLRLTQEMYLEDQAQPEQQIGELHSW